MLVQPSAVGLKMCTRLRAVRLVTYKGRARQGLGVVKVHARTQEMLDAAYIASAKYGQVSKAVMP